jgi:hypothetical protein
MAAFHVESCFLSETLLRAFPLELLLVKFGVPTPTMLQEYCR